MEIKDITNRETLEEFFNELDDKTFLQSWEWGIVQQRLGNKIFRIGIYDKNELIAPALILKIKARRGTFFLIQHFLFNPKKDSAKIKFDVLRTLLNWLKEAAKEEKVVFVRIAPLWKNSTENEEIFNMIGFRNSPIHASSYETTVRLSLDLPEDKLLENMRKTTRYLIKKVQKDKKIEIIKSRKIDDIKIYQKIIEKTATAKKFIPFPYALVKNEFDVFLSEDKALLFLGNYEGKTIGAALVIFWSNIAFYHQAGFDAEYHKVPIAYSMQWEIIKEAKRRGCKFYDLWGYVDPKKYPKHPWAGPSLFKIGFGGIVSEYVRTKDYPFSLIYWPIFYFEKFRSIKKGLSV